MSTLDHFQCALITGGGGGLGKAMAKSLIASGKKVILAGRTASTLQATAEEIGAEGYYTLDTGDIASLPGFIEKLTAEHPEVDCLINNAGVQKPFQVLGPDYGFDLGVVDQEVDINIRGPVHLTVLFIQNHLAKRSKGKDQKGGGVVMNVSSVLGFVPFSIINPVYDGTKSFLHMFSVGMRAQLQKQGSGIRIVEIVPPQVESDLHRDRVDPDDNKQAKGAKGALTIEQFMQGLEEGWRDGKDTIGVGPGKEVVAEWDDTMGKRFNKIVNG